MDFHLMQISKIMTFMKCTHLWLILKVHVMQSAVRFRNNIRTY